MNHDEEAIRFARSFGFTPSDHTFISGIKQLCAGEYLHYNGSYLSLRTYYKLPSLKSNDKLTRKEAEQAFFSVIEQTTSHLSALIEKDAPVALPLSGGFDSRLIGLMLKKMGKKNVTCFTFGNRSDKEALVSEKIAKRLGYDWLFVDYRDHIGENYLQDPLFQEYVAYFCNGTSFPYLQEYFAGKYFKENNIFSANTIFLPGHSGDMAGGSHLYPNMEHFRSKEDLARNIYQRCGDSIPLSKEQKRSLLQLIKKTIPYEEYDKLTHQSHDDWNCRERQSKHIINSSRVWNFFGYDYLLPLWDDTFTSFLFSLPFPLRVYKNLYDDCLLKLFSDNNLLLEEETPPSIKQKQTGYLKKRLREDYPVINKIRPKNHFAHDFFYLKELLQVMTDELGDYPYNNGVGVLTEWYIRRLFKPRSSSLNLE